MRYIVLNCGSKVRTMNCELSGVNAVIPIFACECWKTKIKRVKAMCLSVLSYDDRFHCTKAQKHRVTFGKQKLGPDSTNSVI